MYDDISLDTINSFAISFIEVDKIILEVDDDESLSLSTSYFRDSNLNASNSL